MIVFTDLDGTLLEEDGALAPVAAAQIARLRARGIPVVPLTSKTRRELEEWLALLDSGGAGAFENGAGIVLRERETGNGQIFRKGKREVEILPAAVPVRELRLALDALRRRTRLPLLSFEEIPDSDWTRLTGLSLGDAPAARAREFDLPFLAPEGSGEALSAAALPPRMRRTRGGRFWHLSGRHDKGDALRLLTARLGGGPTIGLGDAPNDAPFLRLVDRAILVPRAGGVDATLAALVPLARRAPAPAGAGWAAAVEAALGESEAA